MSQERGLPSEPMKRFWDKVQKTNKCWNWIAGTRGNGYGTFKFNGKAIDSHRFVWLITFGEIPIKKMICHRCDNRKCVRPDHLFLGTAMDNVHDAIKKGRITPKNHKKLWGEKNPRHKLSNDDIVKIRKLLSTNLLRKDIARKFNISTRHLRYIAVKKWRVRA